MNQEQREVVADWLIVFGTVGLFVSLFLTWSHQFSRTFLAQWGGSTQLQGVPHDPTAWQVYSVADVLLALLVVALFSAAMVGGRGLRIMALVGAAAALAFTIHAISVPPTNGANIFDPAIHAYAPNAPGSGAGETVALAALALAIAGLGLSFTAD